MAPSAAVTAAVVDAVPDAPVVAREVGAVGLVQGHVEAWLVPLVVLVTQLGDPAVLALVLAGLYWRRADRREDVAAATGVALVAYAIAVVLKHAFAFPRPDEPLVAARTLPWVLGTAYELAVSAGGYGFPSGHALLTTAVALQVAGLASVGTYRRRLAGALAVVAAVSLSRLALGVHYLADVAAGVALGVGVVLAARWVLARRSDPATAALGVAVAASGVAVLVTATAAAGTVTGTAAGTGAGADAVLLLGAALGGLGGWQLVALGGELLGGDRPPAAARALVRRGGLAAPALLALYGAVEYFPPLSVPALAGALGLAVAGLCVVPVARESGRTDDARRILAFWTAAALRELHGLIVRYGGSGGPGTVR